MLLYDRIQAWVHQCRQRRGYRARLIDRPEPIYREVRDAFDSAVVFDLTDMLPLVGDFADSKDKPLPRRPPFDPVWCEWDCSSVFDDRVVCHDRRTRPGPTIDDARDQGLLGCRMRCGHLILYYTPEGSHKVIKDSVRETAAAAGTPIPDGPLWSFASIAFRYVESFRYADGSRPSADVLRDYPRSGWTAPLSSSYVNITPHTEDGRLCTPVCHRIGEPLLVGKVEAPTYGLPAGLDVLGPFCLPTTDDVGQYAVDSLQFYHWPAVMAFTLLHCKNVVTETTPPDPKVQRHVEKAGMPPRSSFKTLKLVLPATVKKKPGDDAEGVAPENPGVRFHLMRGHFKDLRHPRYKNPGLHWWNAAWRGSREAGEVLKDYAVKG